MSDLKEKALEEFNNNLDLLLNNKITDFESDCLSIGSVTSILESKGNNNHDYDSNGWQHDYWMSYTLHDGRIISIYGNDYYGGISLSFKED